MPAPIPYFGGKQQLAEKLIALFPPHRTYVEGFGGAGGVLFAKPPSAIDIYNDCDADLVNFMRVLRDPHLFPDFYQRACLSPYSRDEWRFCRDHLRDDPAPVERARRFFVLARFSFSGLVGHSFACDTIASRGGMIRKASAYHGVLSLLPRLSERLGTVLIEHQDFRRLIPHYDSPETFFYLDPPYLPDTRRSGGYAHDMTTDDHRELVALLQRVQGKVMLSGYPNALYDTLGWRTHSWPRQCHVAALPKRHDLPDTHQRTECVWMNY